MLVSKRAGVSCRTSAASPRQCSARTAAVSSRVSLASWYSSRHEASHSGLLSQSQLQSTHSSGVPTRKTVTMMGNKASGGIFSPVVTVTRNIMGEKEFNKLRGKAISLHSQVIKDFCKQFGVENKQVQGVIRLAKKNGEWLGFLA